MILTTILMLVLLILVPVRTSSGEVTPQKTTILKCTIADREGSIGINSATFNVEIDLIGLRLWVGVVQYEIISLSPRSVVALLQEGDSTDSGAELMVINRNNGSFQRSELSTNLDGTQRLWWSGSCSPTPI